MGNVRSEKVKRVARKLLERYPRKFTVNFTENKELVASLVNVPSKKFRNLIAGYVTRLTVSSQKSLQTDEGESPP